MTLALAQHLNCRYWLVDGRTNCPPHRFGIHNWLEEEYLPRVRDVLGRPLCLAYLVPTHWQQLPGSKYIVSTEGTPTATYRLALFDQEAAALTWLEHCRAR